MKILIAEDEEDIRKMLLETLEDEGYEVIGANNGIKALELYKNQKPDIGVFDSMMPLMDGISLMRKIREDSNMPIIFVTARGHEMDKVLALSLGADDYMVKPFSIAELKARIGVQARRLNLLHEISKEENRKLCCGEIEIDTMQAIAYFKGNSLKLSAKEYQLLLFFMRHQEQMFTKKQLYDEVWKEDYIYNDNTIMVHISRLRNKIEDNPKEPKYLVTFKGLGYKLTNSSHQ